MTEEDEVQIDLFVFWRYHNGEVNTFVGGRTDKMRHDGKCRVPAYGSTWWVTPDCMLPVATGEKVLESIKEEEKALRNEIKSARELARARIESLIFPKLIKTADGDRKNEKDWTNLCNELGLVDEVPIDKLIERIRELKNEIYSANKTLAEYCAEVDPGRCSLDSTIKILIAEVLGPVIR